MSVLDIEVITVCCFGLFFILGLYAGRAATWRDGYLRLLYMGMEEADDPRQTEYPKAVPPPLQDIRGPHGAPTRVVKRRK